MTPEHFLLVFREHDPEVLPTPEEWRKLHNQCREVFEQHGINLFKSDKEEKVR